MNKKKSTTLSFRITPALKDALKIAAAREHRSITNMIEILIRNYCKQNYINISNKINEKHK